MDIKEKFYLGISYCRKLNFLLNEKSTETFDRILLASGIKDSALNYNKKHTSKRIVFVGLLPNHRVAKIAKWLKKKTDFELIVLQHSATIFNDLLPEFYHRKILYRNKIHLERIMEGMKNVDLVYAYASKSSYAKMGIEKSNVPTVFDPYDSYIVYYGKNTSMGYLLKELVDEEFCFKNATAVLARNPESYLSLKMYGLPKKPAILFSDYCDNENFTSRNIKPEEDNISIVYSGGIYGKHMKRSSHGFNDFSVLIDRVDEIKVHFYIYPNPATYKEVYYDFVETADKLNYLHICETVPQKDLSKELSQYHFGVLPHFKDADSTILTDKLERGTSLKFYNFLEAGIPILVSNEMGFMAWVVTRYNIGIVFSKADIPHLRAIILKSDYEEMKKNVLKVREKLSMENNVNRLIGFLKKVSEMNN